MYNVIIPEWYEKRIKEKPFEERVREQVRANCHYMDKLDIYEWIANDEIKINNLQSKIDKANEYIDKEIKRIQQHEYARGIRILRKLEEILKEEI